MSDNVSLTIKIDPALKETLKALALENQTTLSQEVTRLVQNGLSPVQDHEVDSLDTEEETVEQLSSAELKQVRSLLKKSKKKK